MAQWLRGGILLGWLIGAGAGIGYVAIFGQRFRLFHQGYARELSVGQVAVWHCTATAAARVESRAEGALPGFLLQVDEQQMLFLDSFHLTELAGDVLFPCQRFDVVLLPNTDLVVRVICLEGAFTPNLTYQLDPAREALPQQPVMVPGDLTLLVANGEGAQNQVATRKLFLNDKVLSFQMPATRCAASSSIASEKASPSDGNMKND
jgi:hypothetical protein